MTDTTAFAGQMACLLLGLRALDRGGHGDRELVLALALGLFAFTVREISLAAPLAVLFGRLLALPWRADGLATLGGTLALLLASGVFFAWRQSLPGGEEPWLLGAATTYERAEQLLRAYFTCAFALAPAVVLVAIRAGRGLVTRVSAVAGAVVLLLGLVTVQRGGGSPLTVFSGRLLGDASRPAAPLLAPDLGVMTLAALASGVALSMLLARAPFRSAVVLVRSCWKGGVSGEAPDRTMTVVVLTTYGAITAIALAAGAAAGTSGVYDRYLWGIGLVVLVLVGVGWTDESRRTAWAAVVAALTLAVVAIAVVLEEQTAAVERWRAGEDAVSRGLTPTEIDAGFEWMGWHYPYAVGAYAGADRWRRPGTWYNVLKFQGAANCVVMSYTPRAEGGLVPFARRDYEAFLVGGARTLYVYRNQGACRDAVGSAPLSPGE